MTKHQVYGATRTQSLVLTFVSPVFNVMPADDQSDRPRMSRLWAFMELPSIQRHEIGDEPWDRIKDLLPGKPSDPGWTAVDNHGFINAPLWIVRTGAPGRHQAGD